MKRVGFVGAGVMGHGMASRLLAAGYAVTVIAHRNRGPIDDLISKGASEASGYVELAGASDVVILCVSNSRVVEQVVEALKPGLRPGMMIIDTGTSSPGSTRAVHRALAAMEVSFVESPVTGGVKQAAAGELGALVGADPPAFEGARPLLEVMCRTVHHFGPPGTGNTAKLLNNYMVFGIAALVIEAFGKAREAGVDWQKLYDVVICGSADSGVLRRIVGHALEGDYGGYVFSVENSLKDIQYFGELSESMGGVSELAAAVTHIFEKAVAEGHGERRLSELLSPDLNAAIQRGARE
ncbi:MAG: NAD(P)-dependent oxidoreductase [Arenicellales bacterium]